MEFAILDTPRLIEHINNRLNNGWLVIFEQDPLRILKNIEFTCFEPGTHENELFELVTILTEKYGPVNIGIANKTPALIKYLGLTKKEIEYPSILNVMNKTHKNSFQCDITCFKDISKINLEKYFEVLEVV